MPDSIGRAVQPSSVAAFAGVPGQPSAEPPGSPIPGVLFDADPVAGTPPIENTPPGGDAPGGNTPGGSTPPNPNPLPGAGAPSLFAAGPTVPGVSGDDPVLDRLDPLLDDDDPSTPPPGGEINPLGVAPVPEPGTMLLLGGGLAGLIARRWRSNKKLG